MRRQPIKDDAIPKVKVDKRSLQVFKRALRTLKQKSGNTDLSLSSWVRKACRAQAAKDLGVRQQELFPWMFDALPPK